MDAFLYVDSCSAESLANEAYLIYFSFFFKIQFFFYKTLKKSHFVYEACGIQPHSLLLFTLYVLIQFFRSIINKSIFFFCVHYYDLLPTLCAFICGPCFN